MVSPAALGSAHSHREAFRLDLILNQLCASGFKSVNDGRALDTLKAVGLKEPCGFDNQATPGTAVNVRVELAVYGGVDVGN
jgi:hypothetical protein